MEQSPSSFEFTVERSEPELITPAKPTPYEFKFLSDLDSNPAHRSHASIILVFPKSDGVQGRDPAKVIKEAISETLVHYYPLAGRLLEGPKGKLIVECNGEGALFIEAYANVRLDDFGFLPPPFPAVNDLIYDVPGSRAILDSPLLLFQVTRLLCGGFIFANRACHIMLDGLGCARFLQAIGEIARGASVPSVQPIWSRRQLNMQRPRQVSPVNKGSGNPPALPFDNMTQLSHRSFFFGQQEIATLRSHLPSDAHSYTRWEVITACLWRCRTVALNFSCNDEVYLLSAVNIRPKLNPPLPDGFYGNASVGTLAVTTAGKLCQDAFLNTVELVRTAKTNVTGEFIKATIDGSVQRSSPVNMARAYIVTDLSRLGFQDCDFGWGKPTYWNPPWDCKFASAFLSLTNEKGENGVAVPIQLPEPAMKRFATEIAKMVTTT